MLEKLPMNTGIPQIISYSQVLLGLRIQTDPSNHREGKKDRNSEKTPRSQSFPTTRTASRDSVKVLIVLAMLIAVIKSQHPALTVTTQLANTAGSGPTHHGSGNTACFPPLTHSAFPPFTLLYTCTAWDNGSVGNIKIFTHDMTLRVTVDSGFGHTFAAVLKDSLILGVGSLDSSYFSSFQLTVSGGVFSTATLAAPGTLSPAYRCQGLVATSGSSLFICTDSTNNKIYRVDQSTRTVSGEVLMPGSTGFEIQMTLEIPSISALLSGKPTSGSVPILARVDFSTIKNPTWSTSSYYFFVDNIDDKYLMMFPGPCIRHFNRLTWNVNTDTIHSDLDLSSYGSTNNILNFGPYQYVVTIPTVVSGPSNVLVISKTTFVVIAPVLTIAGFAAGHRSPHFGTLTEVGSKFYLVVYDQAVKNFQSYYLTVDRCAVRDGSNVCTDCVDGLGLYRVGTAPNNLCMTTAEFPAGYGIDTSQSELANLCSDVNCANCLTDRLICLLCNAGRYLKTGLCYHPTLTPIIPDFFGANTVTGTADACQETHCKLCKATYTTCTGCDTGTGWYLDGTTCKHATLAPVFPASKGPNTGTGLVVTCNEANCLTCSSTYLTCTACIAGWYIKAGLCYHPTLTPIIADFFGANTVTGTADACQDTHCKLCKATYTTCIGCDTGTGWYLDGTTCKHATLAPVFPASKGPNTGTGLVVTCNEANCQTCSASYLTCSVCIAGWYIKAGLCYHPTLPPIIADFFGANTVTGTADACQDTHCKLCKATYTTCTGCDTGTGWYLDGTTCKHATLAPVFPASKGPNTGTGLVVTCNEANCLTCSSTYLTCTACIAGWYIKAGVCYHPTLTPIIADFFGANTVTGTADACQDTHCKLCKATYTTCTGCDTGTGWYLDGTTCKHATLAPVFPASKGPNTGTGLVVPCQDTNCQTCSVSYLTCSVCIAAWYLKTGLCYHPNLTPIIPDFFGANTVTGTADACQENHCKLCKATYTTCTGCDTGTGWYLDGTTCKHATLAPVFGIGTGPNTVTGLVVSCSESLCNTCSSSYNSCTAYQCSIGTYYYMGTCYHPTIAPIIPDFFGANTVTGTADACQDTHCKLCKATYTTCIGCDTGTGWYLDGTICEHATLAPLFPASKGPNTGTGLVVSCNEANCLTCSSTYLTCTACIAGWYIKAGLCYHPTLTPIIADFFGANTVTGTADACQDTHCKLCKATYTTCTGCDTGIGWYLDGTTCKHATLAPVFPASKGPNTGTGLVVTCNEANCLTCSSTYLTCTACIAGWYIKAGLCYHPTLTPIIADFFGANTVTGTADACQETHCKLCKSTYTTCTGCDTGTGWYLDGTICEHATLAPLFPASKGPNTVTGLVVPCQDTNCQTCSASYLTCAVCIAGWYLKTGLCYHPTLTPIIPDFFGANTVTGTADACQDTHCKLCKATYTTCTGCDTGTGWYLDGTTCKHATLTPIIADFFGANTVTGTADACQETHCKLCKATYTTCTGCDTGTGWYLDGTTCKHATLAPLFPASKGPNTVSGLVVPCQDTNCQTCSASYLTCSVCIAGWYLKTGLCYHPTLTPIIPDFFGANTVTGTADACQDTHCKLCKATYTTCTGCDTGTGWYLDGTTCKHATLAPVFPASKGPNTGTGLVVSCNEANCLTCSSTYLTCTACIAGWYIKAGLCYHPTLTPIIADFFGANTVTGTADACQDTHCKLCKATYTTCTGCDTGIGWYLDGTTCKHATLAPVFPATKGPDIILGVLLQCSTSDCLKCSTSYQLCEICQDTFILDSLTNLCNPTILPCTDSHCFECLGNPSVCDACKKSEGWYLDINLRTCFHRSLEPKIKSGTGPVLTAGIVRPCVVDFCLNCSANYQICTECDQANGYVLVNGTCHKLTIITTAVKPTKADVDLSWKQQIADTPIQVNTSKVYKTLIANKVKYKLTATDNSDLGSYSFTIENYDQHVILDFTMPKGLPKEQYNVELQPFNFTFFNDTGQNLSVFVLSGNSVYNNIWVVSMIKGEIEMISALTTTVAAPDSATGLAVMGTLLALDTTGTFFRFTKILQIVNKLYFININYGKRLEPFLAKSATIQSHQRVQNEFVLNSKIFRGKLTNKKVTLSGISMPLMMYKIIFYVLSWLLRGVKRYVLNYDLMNKVGYIFCHYFNRAHLLIFNIVFIDLLWLLPRTLMQSKNLPFYVFYPSLLVMCLIAADLCLLLAHLLDDRIWRKALEHYTSLQEFVPAPDPSSKEKKNDSSMNALKKPDQPSEQDGPNQPQTKQINYKRTYFEIDFNVHLMDMATNTLSMTKDVVDSMIVRLLVAQHWLLVPSLQLTILSTQYANCFGITIMLSIELCKLFATIYAYLKYKYLKNIICLLMELSNQLIVGSFLVITFLISNKRMDEEVSDVISITGIWILVVGCIAEYLLLLTYIGVAAYDFFKNRKMMKKMNVQRRTYAFLKFDESHRDVGNRLHNAARASEQQSRRPARPLKWRAGAIVAANGRTATHAGAKSQTAAGRQRPGNAGLALGAVRWKTRQAPATNNPQLLKFDGESAPPPVDIVARKGKFLQKKTPTTMRERNKSLKRKQIE
jgi:hypothetical protein